MKDMIQVNCKLNRLSRRSDNNLVTSTSTHHQQTITKKTVNLNNKNNWKTEHAMKVNGMNLDAKTAVVSSSGSTDLSTRATG